MQHSLLFAVAATVLFTSCRERETSIDVTETRRLTYLDQKPAGNIVDLPPLGWRALPPTRFRDVNFLAGPDETVEIFLGNSTGEILDNANRWLGQFGLTPVADEGQFGTVEIIGRSAALVEAKGTYNPGMGGEGGENFALIGAIRKSGNDLLTFKMVGPAEAVEGLREEFLTYCRTLRATSVTDIETETPEPPNPES